MRLTLGQAKTAIAPVISQATNATKLLNYINRACRELLEEGKWVGSQARYQVRVYENSITWPRQLETITALSACNAPVSLRNQWFEFLEYGLWQQNENSVASGVAFDRQDAFSFDDVSGQNKKLKFYCDVPEATGARIFVQYLDENGNAVRTNDGVEGWQDGEFLTLSSSAPSVTSRRVSAWLGVQKPVTNGTVRVYELDTVTGAERALAFYEWDEENPVYRRTFLPGVANCPQGICLTVIGDVRFIEARKDRDYLPITNLDALIYKCQSLYKSDNNDYEGSAVMGNKAISRLNKQLEKHQGASSIVYPRFNIGAAPNMF